jgi:hypothetical protein
VWKSQSDPAGYSSAITEVGGIRQIIVFTGAGVWARRDNGALLWKYDKVSNRTANVATPIFHDGFVFCLQPMEPAARC